MTSPALQLAKECGIRRNINDDSLNDTISNKRIETFYAKAQAQALRDAAKRIVGYGEAAYIVNEMADELERKA